MRVLSVAFPGMQVGTAFGGGAEQILSILEAGLVDQGHESLVVAADGSKVAGTLIPTSSAEGHRRAIQAALCASPVDLIHFHGLDFHKYVPECEIPMLATLHLPISFYPASVFDRHRFPHLRLNCVSQDQADSGLAGLLVIQNGIPNDHYAPHPHAGFLLWLGRICPEKGAHLALEVAHRLDARLIVAGPVHPYPAHLQYFADRVQSLLDERRIYAGPADLEQKRCLLARAQCLLVPSLIAETSSLVAMEALSAGTPVVAFRTGALPGLVDHGETGFIVDSAEEMACAVSEVGRLSRAHCREQAVRRFDSHRMIRDYLDLYARMTTRHFPIGAAPGSEA